MIYKAKYLDIVADGARKKSVKDQTAVANPKTAVQSAGSEVRLERTSGCLFQFRARNTWAPYDPRVFSSSALERRSGYRSLVASSQPAQSRETVASD